MNQYAYWRFVDAVWIYQRSISAEDATAALTSVGGVWSDSCGQCVTESRQHNPHDNRGNNILVGHRPSSRQSWR